MTLDPKTNTNNHLTPHQTHLKASEHCDAAAKAHKDAAKHIETGDMKQAGYHAAVAHGHVVHANEHSEMTLKNTASHAPTTK